MPNTYKIWLYTRGNESIRVVVNADRLIVYGPGDDETTQVCEGDEDALLQQKLIEQRLILRGWGLDRLITDRRSGRERRDDDRGENDRRRQDVEDILKGSKKH